MNEISNYIKTGFEWLAIGGGGFLVSYLGLHLASLMSNLLSHSINTNEELQSVVEKEARKLGIDLRISARLEDRLESEARELSDNSYEIVLGGFYATVSSVRHELFHIKRLATELDNSGGLLNYLLKEEPRAIFYEIFRV